MIKKIAVRRPAQKTVKRVGKKPVKMAMKSPAPDWVTELAARVVYVALYLREYHPGPDAPEGVRAQYDFAADCLKDIEKIINEKYPHLIKTIIARPCLVVFPTIPPIGG